MGLTNSKSSLLKNKQKAQLIFSNFYIWEKNDLDRKKKITFQQKS